MSDTEYAAWAAAENQELIDDPRRQQIPEIVWECGPGWSALLGRLHAYILALDPTYGAGQVKQKYGRLRVYVDFRHNMDELYDCIRALCDAAEAESEFICEQCGEPGRMYQEHGWLYTSCEDHHAEDAVPVGRPTADDG